MSAQDNRAALNESIAAKNRWLRELHRRKDANGHLTPEAAREAREAAGFGDDEEPKAAA